MKTFKDYLHQIEQIRTVKELEEMRNEIYYKDNSNLDKSDMFLLGEFIEFRKHYV